MRLLPSVYIGPMSLNIASSLRHTSIWFPAGTVASRRQIEHDGGYVNNWTTEQFADYMRKGGNVTLVRDHAGPGQGKNPDDGLRSLEEDVKYMDIIHIDPWKMVNDINQGTNQTYELIKYCYERNSDILFEVGTEQSIFPMKPSDLTHILCTLEAFLPSKVFDNIVFAVIQSGTSLEEDRNTGVFDEDKLVDMVRVCNKWNIKSKEHNGDYLPVDLIKKKKSMGLNAINIAPEFGKIETDCILNYMELKDRKDLQDRFFEICIRSKKWRKWVSKDFNPLKNQKKIIQICGHYVFSNPEFIEIKKELDHDIDEEIQKVIRSRIMELCQ